MSVQLIDPSTEAELREIPFATDSEIECALQDVAEAHRHWCQVPLDTRLECVRSLEGALQVARLTLSERISQEMGKIQRESIAEIDKCIASCAQLREKFPVWKSEKEYREGEFSIHYQSLGPILAVMPWNFPVWQVIRFAIPALLNGNTILLKHAPNTWGVAEILADIFAQALPHGVYINLFMDVTQVPAVIADARIRAVTLTGSRQAGSRVAALAGQHLKKSVLELGGSDAYVILDDADVAYAAEIGVRSRVMNAGQSCVAAKRFIVTKKNLKNFSEAMVERMQKVNYGPALDSASDIGPLARRDLRDVLHGQVEETLRSGGRLLVGGHLPKGKGYFYPASVITDVQPGQAAFDEELFGPVAAIVPAADEEEAIRLANLSRYGLGGAVFSRDVERARQIALSQIDAGMVFVNDFVRSDALIPFGGIKDSGLGRELGREGCFEFCNIKTLKV